MRSFIKYALLATPAIVMCGLLGIFALATWVAAILNDPGKFHESPRAIQLLTREVYKNTRTMWQTLENCVAFTPHTLYRPKPGSCHFRNAEFSTTIHFDRNGFRVSAQPQNSTGLEAARMVIVGDSHAMGWGVGDDKTFASALATQWGFQTVNLGVASFGTARELLYLQRNFRLQPSDIVVIQYCDNDLQENTNFLKRGQVGPYAAAAMRQLLSQRPLPADLLSISGLLFRMLRYKVGDRIESLVSRSQSHHVDETSMDAADVLLGVIKHFPEIQRHRVMIVPINAYDNRTHLRGARTKLQRAGISLVIPDLGERHFFGIDDHLTPQGHQVVASAIAHTIAAKMQTVKVPRSES